MKSSQPRHSATKLRNELTAILGPKGIICMPGAMVDYAHDEFPGVEIRQLPLAVARPDNARQVSEILKWANKRHVPVTARGGGTGMCGGCVPQKDGIVLSLE